MIIPVAPIKLFKALGACAVALLLIAPGVQAGIDCDDLSGTAIHPNVDWQTDIKPMINELISIDGRCTSCHNHTTPAAGLDLTDEGSDAIYKIVTGYATPGDPVGSRLFSKLNCANPVDGGSQMPLGNDPLTILQREKFYDWIEQGALGEDPESIDGPIFRDFIFRGSMESLRIMQP
jgi:hypothetical protein